MIIAEPKFLTGSAGELFALHVRPETAAERGVVLLPPFAEEMNCARRMLRLQATSLAEAGISALLLDPFGTGDSAGDFGDARWEIWVSDVRRAADELAARGIERVGLLGLRLGAVLAAVAAPTLVTACFGTTLWQPVLRGRQHLTEFLRLHTLPGVLATGGSPTIEGLRARLAEGESVEVAGYNITPQLAAALDMLDLANLAHPALGQVTSLEVVRDPVLPLSAAIASCMGNWTASGLTVATQAIPGTAFWTGQGNSLVAELIVTTTAAFQAVP